AFLDELTCVHLSDDLIDLLSILLFFFFFFFFQAEDGIRDFHVTGVQTCALPILGIYLNILNETFSYAEFFGIYLNAHRGLYNNRSEERRVGKECRSRWSP